MRATRSLLARGALALGVMLAWTQAGADGLDLHWLWDDRCAECHGHAADFARRLDRSGEELSVRHPIGDMRAFLRHHYPPADEVEALYQMLRAQAGSPGRFREDCSGCHGPASALARDMLGFAGGTVVVLPSGDPLATALARHRGIASGQQAFYLELLERVAREVHRP